MSKRLENWKSKWDNEEHQLEKKEQFRLLDSCLNIIPRNILDIGCGFARESEYFQKKYNCDLFLLDGNFDNSADAKREYKYGKVDNFRFYNKIDDLKENWNNRNMRYTFVDANDIKLDKNIKFDLIYSIKSCGFHYPLDTYYKLIKNHSHANTKLVFDIRQGRQGQLDNNFEIVKIFYEDSFRATAEIRIK